MSGFLKVLVAEVHKQHRVYFHSPAVYISLLIWPLLEFLVIYYMYQPFVTANGYDRELSVLFGGVPLEIFLLVGFIGYSFFMSLIQSAWRFTDERYQGTLEIIFLTPANRFAIILGNAISSLFESVWLVVSLSACLLLFYSAYLKIDAPLLLVGFCMLTASAVSWGALLNSFFLITRDAGFAFVVLPEPLSFFSGVRLPITLFANWMRLISYAIPLTFCLSILRRAVAVEKQPGGIGTELLIVTLLSILMLLVSHTLLQIAERRARTSGSFTLF